MKVITEEDVNFICNVIDGVEDRLDDLDKRNIITLLCGHLQEIDTLTVSKLWPMCDAPKDKYVMVYPKDSTDSFEAFLVGAGFMQTRDNSSYAFSDLHGWTEKPTYKKIFMLNGLELPLPSANFGQSCLRLNVEGATYDIAFDNSQDAHIMLNGLLKIFRDSTK